MKCEMLDQEQKRGLTFRKVMQWSTNIKIVEVLPRNEFINTNPFFFQTDDIGSCRGDSGAYIKFN